MKVSNIKDIEKFCEVVDLRIKFVIIYKDWLKTEPPFLRLKIRRNGSTDLRLRLWIQPFVYFNQPLILWEEK